MWRLWPFSVVHITLCVPCAHIEMWIVNNHRSQFGRRRRCQIVVHHRKLSFERHWSCTPNRRNYRLLYDEAIRYLWTLNSGALNVPAGRLFSFLNDLSEPADYYNLERDIVINWIIYEFFLLGGGPGKNGLLFFSGALLIKKKLPLDGGGAHIHTSLTNLAINYVQLLSSPTFVQQTGLLPQFVEPPA